MFNISHNQFAVKEISINESIAIIATLDDQLADLIKFAINSTPQKKYHFYQANYQFGSTIIKNGVFHLPVVRGQSISFNDRCLPDNLKANLAYNIKTDEPFGIVLNKSSELYLNRDDGLYTYAIIKPGYIFGITSVITNIDPLPVNLKAGGRSVFMLHKVSDSVAHANLQRALQFKIATPTSYAEHYRLFVAIANALNCNWFSNVLFFSRNFIEQMQQPIKTHAFANLACYLLQKQQLLSHKRQLEQACNLILNQIEANVANYHHHPLNVAKQALKISLGQAAGFRFSINDEMMPISQINQAYQEHYYNNTDRSKAMTIILEPAELGERSVKYPIYCSLNHPFLQQIDHTAKYLSQISILDETSFIINHCKKILDKQNSRCSQFLNKLIANKEFAFYHNGRYNTQYEHILDTSIIVKTDQRFTQLIEQKQANNTTAKDALIALNSLLGNSSFFKGCIQIVNN